MGIKGPYILIIETALFIAETSDNHCKEMFGNRMTLRHTYLTKM